MFAVSVQGASHSKKEEAEENKELGRKFPCQDKSLSKFFPADTDALYKTSYHLTVVCDGHGGAPYFRSAQGAELAIASMEKILPTCIDEIARILNDGNPECVLQSFDDSSKKVLSLLVPLLLAEWKQEVDSDCAENPIKDKELEFLEMENKQAATRYRNAIMSDDRDKAANEVLRPIYGATFLCVVVTDSFWFALQIGDGDIAIHTHTETDFSMPVPEDERNFLNFTTSLCDRDAKHEFRIALGTDKVDAVICSTDGIANSFANKDQLISFYQTVLSLFRTYSFGGEQESDGDDWKEVAKKRGALTENEIRDSLPDISRRGSGDDVTLAGFVDISEDDVKNVFRAVKLVEEGKKAQTMPLEAEGKFREAAQLGSPEGCYQIGCMLCQKSPAEAIEYLEKALKSGIKDAKEPLATLLLKEAQVLQKNGNHADAFNYFLKSAEYGIKEAQYEVGLYFDKPQDYEHCGVKQNLEKAITWTFAAANQGYAEAECKIGEYYRDGIGIRQDEELSLEWYKKAADAGNARAMNTVGVFYYKGLGGLNEDKEEALAWYKKAADAGDARAMNNVGYFYYNGLGGLKEDKREAFTWYKKAADAGNARAMYNVGDFYYKGLCGVTEDKEEALAWFKKASEHGSLKAQKYLKQLGAEENEV